PHLDFTDRGILSRPNPFDSPWQGDARGRVYRSDGTSVLAQRTQLGAISSMSLIPALTAARALAWREIVRFFRQRNRIVGSIGTPLVFWLLFGAGMASSFRVNAGQQTQTFLFYF